jgi:hypothetical protein
VPLRARLCILCYSVLRSLVKAGTALPQLVVGYDGCLALASYSTVIYSVLGCSYGTGGSLSALMWIYASKTE